MEIVRNIRYVDAVIPQEKRPDCLFSIYQRYLLDAFKRRPFEIAEWLN
jgi:hypothetical protein